ncbi:MAG: RtcB family protein [Clostridiales bacterium]|nr:RtcB family protein [Clostridiales bacterium]
MIILQGTYNTAKVFTNTLDKETKAQIENLLEQPFVQGSKIRIMPDTHAGAGSTIGTTMTIKEKVVPHMVGVDIGCGMETIVLKEEKVDVKKLDAVIHQHIPGGFAVRKTPHLLTEKTEIAQLRCRNQVNLQRAYLSIGTLGGGNHFIEVAKGEKGKLYLIIHSGSRNLGLQVADYYQRQAVAYQKRNSEAGKAFIEKATISGKEKEIGKRIKKIPLPKGMSKSLAWLEGKEMEDYLFDMNIVQKYADVNRKAIAQEIITRMKFSVERSFSTIHNYIDLEKGILRKGAISAKAGEEVLIPMNMRDGSLLCVGKGNEDWNCSAPHGAGRIMSRREAKERISLTAYQESMRGIFSSTVNSTTLDEAPYAYKPIEEIMGNIIDTVQIKERLIPIYNFKAAE